MTEREKFAARLALARRAGLVGMGFIMRTDRPLTDEQIFAALNEVEDAIEAGRCVRHDGWRGNEPDAGVPGRPH